MKSGLQIAEEAGRVLREPDLAEAIMSPHRGQPTIAQYRWVAMLAYREQLVNQGPLSLSAVGRAFGRDRTTVRHGLARVKALLISDDDSMPMRTLRKLRRRLDDFTKT